MDLTKSILSVSYFCENGTETHLAREPFFKYGDRREPLIKKMVCTSSRRRSFTKSRAQSSHACEQEIHKSGRIAELTKVMRAGDSQKSRVRVDDSQNSSARARELPKSCVRAQNPCVQAEGLQICKIPMYLTPSSNQLLKDPVHDDRIHVEGGAEPIPVPCEPSESEKMKHELTHIAFKPWSTSCVKGKAQSEPHKRIGRIVEDSELPKDQCDYLVLKDTAASDGLKVLSMCVKSCGYGTSTVVETNGATDTFAMTWRVEMWN